MKVEPLLLKMIKISQNQWMTNQKLQLINQKLMISQNQLMINLKLQRQEGVMRLSHRLLQEDQAALPVALQALMDLVVDQNES